MTAPLRITVLLGGTSSERDVSLASGIRVVAALRECGHTVRAVDPAKGALSEADEQLLLKGGVVKTIPPSENELRQMAREALPLMAKHLPGPDQADVVFLGLHGGHGEDGTLQAMLDLNGVPYTGSGIVGSALGMDKDLSKHLFRAAGVTTADWLMVRVETPVERRAAIERRALDEIGLPLIVKPSKQGSTVGLSIVKKAAELTPAIDEAFRFDDEVMIEQFIAGRGADRRYSRDGRPAAWRNHPKTRDLRLRVQVHPGDGGRRVPGQDRRRGHGEGPAGGTARV